VYIITANDLLHGFSTAGANLSHPREAYILAALFYFVMCYTLSWLVKRLQARIAIIR
jgi:glutamate/aspartate transport system permease protein